MKCPVTVAKRLMLYFSLLVQVFELFYFGLCFTGHRTPTQTLCIANAVLYQVQGIMQVY